MKYKIFNLKENMPTVEQALAMIEIEVQLCRREGLIALKIIHGYGSSGVGGGIKRALTFWAKRSIKKGLFKAFIKGEQWSQENPTVDYIKKLCPEVLGDMELYQANAGVSVILI